MWRPHRLPATYGVSGLQSTIISVLTDTKRMTSLKAGALDSPVIRVVLRIVIYYVILVTIGYFARVYLAHSPPGADALAGTVFGLPQQGVVAATRSSAAQGGTETNRAITVTVAMLAALLLSIPVAWMYQLTRAKRGYQQSVVQLLIILPIVVGGVVVLVKNSLPLAFSLAGIVAAVRFRNTLDDSKDAAYVFLATGMGLAAAVDVPVATALSITFNVIVFVLWYSDFGSAPIELEGRIAQRRLERAQDLARTGTFVAQIDREVMSEMTSEQLEALAQRAWRRARDAEPVSGEPGSEVRLRIKTTDGEATRMILAPRLDDLAKSWRLEEKEGKGNTVHIDYIVQLKKHGNPEDLVDVARAASGPELVDAELM